VYFYIFTEIKLKITTYAACDLTAFDHLSTIRRLLLKNVSFCRGRQMVVARSNRGCVVVVTAAYVEKRQLIAGTQGLLNNTIRWQALATPVMLSTALLHIEACCSYMICVQSDLRSFTSC